MNLYKWLHALIQKGLEYIRTERRISALQDYLQHMEELFLEWRSDADEDSKRRIELLFHTLKKDLDMMERGLQKCVTYRQYQRLEKIVNDFNWLSYYMQCYVERQ